VKNDNDENNIDINDWWKVMNRILMAVLLLMKVNDH